LKNQAGALDDLRRPDLKKRRDAVST